MALALEAVMVSEKAELLAAVAAGAQPNVREGA